MGLPQTHFEKISEQMPETADESNARPTNAQKPQPSLGRKVRLSLSFDFFFPRATSMMLIFFLLTLRFLICFLIMYTTLVLI